MSELKLNLGAQKILPGGKPGQTPYPKFVLTGVIN